MPEPVDLPVWRGEHTWGVLETRSHVLHQDQLLEDDLAPLASRLNEIRTTVCTALQLRPTVKDDEKQTKIHVWIYHPSVLTVRGASITSASEKLFYGTVDGAGTHLVVQNLQWDSPIVLDKLLHEDTHAVWASEAGEAPSLLNEGIAAWIERLQTYEDRDRLVELDTAWDNAIRTNPGRLCKLTNNDEFWNAMKDGLDTYALGGYITRHIVKEHGWATLRAIFQNTTYAAPDLADVIERHLGYGIEQLVEATCSPPQNAEP